MSDSKRKFALVYQNGIANVFEVDSFHSQSARNPRRVLQHAFSPCEWYCVGIAKAGCVVRSFACPIAGDCANGEWFTDLESAPFSESFHPVYDNQEAKG